MDEQSLLYLILVRYTGRGVKGLDDREGDLSEKIGVDRGKELVRIIEHRMKLKSYNPEVRKKNIKDREEHSRKCCDIFREMGVLK